MSKTASNSQLLRWYSSDHAKRALGGICQKVNEQGVETTLLGSRERPLLILRDSGLVAQDDADVRVSIDEARADWPAITAATAIFDARFRIQGKHVQRAVLFRHPGTHHPAERYRRSPSIDANALAGKIEDLAKEIRKLAKSALPLDEVGQIVDRLANIADVIDRRFRETWRVQQGHPVLSTTVQ